jgi:hypothetical protein
MDEFSEAGAPIKCHSTTFAGRSKALIFDWISDGDSRMAFKI